VAVSSTIAADLLARAPELSESRIDVIPNPVDIAGLRARAAAAVPPMEGPYALYLGKLAPNKGTVHLVGVAERSDLPWPLVIVGDGPDRDEIASAARRTGKDVRLAGWVDRDRATAWLAHASLLVFPSRGPESLSRVLLDASALGVPIAAMNTGGTPDVIEHGVTGLLSDTPDALADDVKRMAQDESLRNRLGAEARRRAGRFDSALVSGRMEELYRELREARES
jgi:glycogen synthase